MMDTVGMARSLVKGMPPRASLTGIAEWMRHLTFAIGVALSGQRRTQGNLGRSHVTVLTQDFFHG
jgi:hypothetical protein